MDLHIGYTIILPHLRIVYWVNATMLFSEKIIRDLSEIKKFEPDVILLASPYFQDYKNRENTNYLLLFSDRIYIYRTYYKDLIEINEYVRRHYKKPKKFVEWVMNVLYAFKWILFDKDSFVKKIIGSR